MLVSELIDKLKTYPDDMLVYLQGYAVYESLEPEEVEQVTTQALYLYKAGASEEIGWNTTEVAVIK